MRKQLIFASLLMAALALGCNNDDPEPAHKTGQTTAIFNPGMEYGTVTDIDGNTYRTIQIGTQTWMAENLRVRHYRNGDPIKYEKQQNWDFIDEPICGSYDNTAHPDSIATYGLLYNGRAAFDTRNLAPDGWHIATVDDWNQLIHFVDAGDGTIDSIGFSSIAGRRLKEAGLAHWNYFGVNNADNLSGFTALPAGSRSDSSYSKNMSCFFWAYNQYETDMRTFYSICDFAAAIGCQTCFWNFGHSIRCVKN